MHNTVSGTNHAVTHLDQKRSLAPCAPMPSFNLVSTSHNDHPTPRYLNEQLAALLENVEDIADSATRSALLWIDAALTDPSTGHLDVTPVTLEALGSFLVAAENLEALKWWARAFGANHTHLNVPRLVEVSGDAFAGQLAG